jgi:hypothetical protein
MTDPTALGFQLSIAWHRFLSNGILFAVWTRIESTLGSLVPTYLNVTPSIVPHAGYDPQITFFWMSAHGYSIWGMTGVVLFGFAVVHAAREWSRFRRLVLWFVAPAVLLAEVANGFAYPFASQSMFALVGVIAVIAASGLLGARPRTRGVILGCMAFELLTIVYGGLYRPFNVPVATAVVLTLIAVAGQLALLAALAAALDLAGLRYSSSAIRGASRLKVQ